MSTEIVHLVPADPWFVPSPDLEDRARRLYCDLMTGGSKVESTVDFPMGFVHLVEGAGDFWCPRCQKELDWEWVMDLLDLAEPGPVPLPCCNGTADLGEIRSDRGDCFARFTLHITDPDCRWNDPPDVPPDVIAAIADLLGTPMVSATMHL